MADYDPPDPDTWAPGDVLDVREIARRVSIVRGRELSVSYVQRNLTHRPGFPDPIPWEINSGRAWKWGEALKWFKTSGRLS